MRKVNNITELIGRTPMVRINRMADPNGAQLWAKLEIMNPASSVKDRIALRIIDDFEEQGLLKPGGTIVEATSGNTGMGLAMVCAVRGYNTVFVMPDKVSEEKRRMLRAMGAEVVICPTSVQPDDPRSYYSVSRRISEEIPGAVLGNQYENPSNRQSHYDTTGPEIWEQMDGRIDVFVASLGTGGTISGVAKYLKEHDPDIRVVAADPFGSIYKTYKETGEIVDAHSYLVEGIGEDFIPGNALLDLVDEIVNITDEDSFYYSRQLARQEGILAGGSTGSIMKVAIEVAAALPPEQVVVTIIADTGERYLSKHFSDEWMQEKGFLQREKMTLRQLLQQKKDRSLATIISAAPGATVRQVLDLMTEKNISQLPVIGQQQNLGSLRDSALLTLALADKAVLDTPVEEVMEEPFPSVDESATVAHSTQLLLQHQGLVLTKGGQPVGFITRHDAIDLAERS